jgi:hypothetical protein
MPNWFENALNTIDKSSRSPIQLPDNPFNVTPPSNLEMEVLLPAVPSAHSEEGEDNNQDDSLANQPEVRSHRVVRRCHVDKSLAPTGPSTLSDPLEVHAPRLRVRNSVPFNPRERDNDIGALTRRAHATDSRKYVHLFLRSNDTNELSTEGLVTLKFVGF